MLFNKEPLLQFIVTVMLCELVCNNFIVGVYRDIVNQKDCKNP